MIAYANEPNKPVLRTGITSLCLQLLHRDEAQVLHCHLHTILVPEKSGTSLI